MAGSWKTRTAAVLGIQAFPQKRLSADERESKLCNDSLNALIVWVLSEIHFLLWDQTALKWAFPNPPYIYCIAGNFRGSKLSQIRPKIIFTELIFTNFIIQPFCTILFIISQILFSRISKITKRAKVIGLESFQLYSILEECCNLGHLNLTLSIMSLHLIS